MFKKRNSAPLARVVTPSRARARSEQGADMAPPLLRLPPRSPIPCLVLKVGSGRLLLRGTGSGSRAPGLPQQTTVPLYLALSPLARARTRRAGRGDGPTVTAAAADVADYSF